MTIRHHLYDLPDLANYDVDAIAIDTETLGLNPHRDRLCVVQISPGDGTADVIQIAPGQKKAPNLVSLLKNRDGEIDLHLPISGTLDDPQFSVFGLVVRALFNLVGKAITAPFSLLAAALGGGEELSQLDLAPGAVLPAEAQTKKLAALGDALVDRPALRLDVTGRADPAVDGEGLKRAMLDRQVQAEKLKAMMAAGQDAPPVDEIEIGAEEYPELLKKAYRAADFKKPRNLIGMMKDIPVAEMEALMIANSKVGEEDFRLLAQRRAQAVKDWLIAEGGVPAERIFVLEPKVEPSGEQGQVVFSLR